jgi:hypothetical protein
MSVNTLVIPSIPPDFMVASPSIGDAHEDASRFLRENSMFMKKSTVDSANTKFNTAMTIYKKIPRWMMMPLFAICMVIVVVLGIPLFIVFVELLQNHVTFMRLVSLVSLVWIVGIMALFV